MNSQTKDFSGKELIGKDFNGQNLAEFDFSAADLTEANLNGADCPRAFFFRTRLREAQASGYQLLHKPVAPAKLRAFLQHVQRTATIQDMENML